VDDPLAREIAGVTLRLPTDLREAMIDHVREGAPEEVVGVLAGQRGADSDGPTGSEGGTVAETSVIERRYPAENAVATPETRYEIAPAEEFALLERVDDAGLDVVGFYHSHPRGPSAPSGTDARLAAWPGYSYVVVSLAGGEPTVGSWRWTGETFQRETIEVA
jgi:proteasome lid subunit RPN8/RPN11